MRKLAGVLVVVSILLVVYCFMSKLAGQPIANFGLLKITTVGGLVFAIYLAQIAILLKLSGKK